MNMSVMHVFYCQRQGTGIAEPDLPHIFQMFYTSREKSADSRHGIGLCLAICEANVKAHGGTIGARNRADGPGSEFVFFRLPMQVTDEE
jgi:two-component system sensor histidine kinase KdpD